MRAMLQREAIRPFTALCRDSASGAGNEALTSSILAARNRETQVSQARRSALAGLVLLAACGGNTVTPPAAEPVFVPFKPAFRGFVGDASLPEPRGYVSLIEVGGFLYSVGGIPPTAPRPPFVNATPTVYFTRILGDGSLEPWRETASLNVARNRTALVAWNPPGGPRALFALGGHADDLRGLDSVERAFVQPDGTLSPWERMAPLPAVLIDGVVSQIGNTVVLTGGFLSADPTAPRLDSVFVGTLGPAGPGAWHAATPLPETTTGGAALTIGNRVHVVIGYTLESRWSPSVYSGTLDPTSGTISTWVKGPSILSLRYYAGAAPDGHGGFFLVGGIAPGGHLAGSEHSASDTGGNLVGWTPLGFLPVATGAVAAVGTRDHVYVVGGLVGSGASLTSTANVWRTALN
jgi:hypothetical protein